MIYKKNDFVKYIGDYTTLDPIRRNEDLGTIIEITEGENYTAKLDLLSSNKQIICPLELLRPLDTEEIHLRNLGFNEVLMSSKQKYFERDGIIISSIAIFLSQKNFVFMSGLCIGDLTNLTNNEIENFIIDGNFDFDKFYAKYKKVQNINQLIDAISSMKWNFDIKSILS